MKLVTVVTAILVLLAFAVGGVGVVAAETVDTEEKDKPIVKLCPLQTAGVNSDGASFSGQVPCEVGEGPDLKL